MDKFKVFFDFQGGLTSVFKKGSKVALLEHGQITEEGKLYCAEKGIPPDANALLTHALSNRVRPDQVKFEIVP